MTVHLVPPTLCVAHVVLRRAADTRELTGPPLNVGVCCQDGTALSRGEVFRWKEREARHICDAADRPTVVFRSDGMCGILNKARARALTNDAQRVQVCWVPSEVNRCYDPRAIGHGGGYGRWVYVESVVADVNEFYRRTMQGGG